MQMPSYGAKAIRLAKILKQEKRNSLETLMEKVGVEFNLDGPWQYLKGLNEAEEVFYNVNLIFKEDLGGHKYSSVRGVPRYFLFKQQ